MPRITHVARAQQRYATKPVLDEHGQPKVTPVMRNGVQRKTKHGKPITMAVTERDLDRPLPLARCGACGKDIEVGTPYKWMEPKTSAYGGQRLTRHEACPNWQVWEYSNSLSARIAQIEWEATSGLGDSDEPDDYTAALSQAAESIRELAQEKQEAADNIESGFEHPTAQSEELAEQADALEQWADEVEETEVPDLPEPEEDECGECQGSGQVGNDDDQCPECDGTGQVTPDEPTEDQMAEWRDEAAAAVSEALSNSPV